MILVNMTLSVEARYALPLRVERIFAMIVNKKTGPAYGHDRRTPHGKGTARRAPTG